MLFTGMYNDFGLTSFSDVFYNTWNRKRHKRKRRNTKPNPITSNYELNLGSPSIIDLSESSLN